MTLDNGAIEEQVNYSSEVTANLRQVVAGAENATASIFLVQGPASSTETLSAQLLSAATALSQWAAVLRTEIDGFLVSARVA